MNKTNKKKAEAPISGKAVGESRIVALKRLLLSLSESSGIISLLFFPLLWLALVIFEPALLQRVEELSVFLFDETYFNEMMSVPAGFLSYIGSFLVQFFHIPALGAAIYVLLLLLVYVLTIKVFNISKRYSFAALLPVLAIVASNAQLGYWIFYLKLPGYYYVALLGVLFSLFALWAFRKMPALLRLPFVVLWVIAGYPLFGVYALASAVVMALLAVSLSVQKRQGYLLSAAVALAAFVAVYIVPGIYYDYYATVASDIIYAVGTPVYQWTQEYVAKVTHEVSSYWHNIDFYWVPFYLLLAIFLLYPLLAMFRRKLAVRRMLPAVTVVAVPLFALLLLYFYWYRDQNFRIENKQNCAMWAEDWEAVAEYAMDAEEPTRQIILNKNMALLRLGKAGDEMFSYPDGSAEILSPMAVHLTQTGGKMLYYQYGKFNFCYRWCMEDAVEYGWRIEYLKHAARSLLLSGEHTLAQRYLNILKSTMFHSAWANEMEKYIDNPSLIAKEPAFGQPMQMACYDDALDVDDSFVEAYLTKNLMYMPEEPSPEYAETSLTVALIKKDRTAFWRLLNQYIVKCIPHDSNKRPKRKLPVHYQEAYLLFKQLELQKPPAQRIVNVDELERHFEAYFISQPAKDRFRLFMEKVALFNGINAPFRRAFPEVPSEGPNAGRKSSELYLSSHFSYDYGDTYYYYFYFVRKIRTN